MLLFFVTEPLIERKVAPIDWAGAILLTSGMSTLLWVVLDGSRRGIAVDATALLVARLARRRRTIRCAVSAGSQFGPQAIGDLERRLDDEMREIVHDVYCHSAAPIALAEEDPVSVRGVRASDKGDQHRTILPARRDRTLRAPLWRQWNRKRSRSRHPPSLAFVLPPTCPTRM